DFYPVTTLGRFVAAFVMFSGVGIIGALASILATLLLAPASPDEVTNTADAPAITDAMAMTQEEDTKVESELAQTRAELALTRASLDQTRGEMAEIKSMLQRQLPAAGNDAG